jgi:hypothetical protein
MTRSLLIISILFVTLACSTPKPPGAAVTTPGTSPQYQIVLNRPYAAKDRLRVVVAAKQQVAAAQDDGDQAQGAVDKDIHLSLAGVLTIRKVDANGRAVSALLEVEYFKDGVSGMDLVPPDTKIEAVRKGEEFSLTVNDRPRPDLQQYLELAFPLHRPGSPLGDELFGTKDPKQIGDTWAFSKSKVTESLIEDGYAVRETNLSGNTRLQRTRLVGGVECLELTSKVHADGAALGEGPDSKGAGAATLDATIAMVVPVDTKLPLAMEESTTRAAFEAGLKEQGSTSSLGLTVTRYRKANYTPMPASSP